MGTRREAREHALTLCYELDVRGRTANEMLADLPVPPDAYAASIVAGVDADREALDQRIGEAAEHWTLDRMAVIDRVLLRIGAFELAHHPEVPTAVVIDEAVELAKRYSTEESGRFVNGVLSRLAGELRGAAGDTADAAPDLGGDGTAVVS
ncbi:MAG TPA: transcription antitermination factor NusB [Acidimicrobiia bacterium]|nr:transcription antitermination factor NusB [Acidimicrobiia bacterium]